MGGQEGERPEPQREDAGALIVRRLAELATERGSEAAEQIREEKASGTPLPKALVLMRRLSEVEQDLQGLDEHTRRDAAIIRYACGRAVLDELIRQDAELSVIVNRQKGRPDTHAVIASDEQDEAVRALEGQRRRLMEAFPTVDQIPLSPRQQQIISDVVGRVGIRQPQPMEHVSLERASLQWLSIVVQEEAEAALAATDPDLAAHRRVIVRNTPGRGSGGGKPPPRR